MILLDANYLILALVEGSPEAEKIIAWQKADVPLITNSIVWYEFLCGPVDGVQAAVIHSLLHDIVPFGPEQAQEAARLFNAIGSKRKLRFDAMIAATAILTDAKLATNNANDFFAFTEHGLQLV